MLLGWAAGCFSFAVGVAPYCSLLVLREFFDEQTDGSNHG